MRRILLVLFGLSIMALAIWALMPRPVEVDGGVGARRAPVHGEHLGGTVVDDQVAARFVVEPKVERDHIALREKLLARGGSLVSIRQGLGA